MLLVCSQERRWLAAREREGPGVGDASAEDSGVVRARSCSHALSFTWPNGIFMNEQERDVWDDTRIPPGADRRREIAVALQRAKVAVLLVRADLLASEIVATDVLPSLLTAAKEENLKLFSVLLHPCAFYETELAQIVSVNRFLSPVSEMSKGKRAALWRTVTELIRTNLHKRKRTTS